MTYGNSFEAVDLCELDAASGDGVVCLKVSVRPHQEGAAVVEKLVSLHEGHFKLLSGPRDQLGEDGEPDYDPMITYKASGSVEIASELVFLTVEAQVNCDSRSCHVVYKTFSADVQVVAQQDQRWFNRFEDDSNEAQFN